MADDLIHRVHALDKRLRGHPKRRRKVIPQLIALLSEASGPEEVLAVVEVLGGTFSDAASLALLPLAGHPDEDVRYAVAHWLPLGVEHAETEVPVADALVRLARDPSAEVRAWAVFGLGTFLELDTPAGREVMRECLWESDRDVRIEALCGLAARREPGVLELIRDELELPTVEPRVVAAALAYADRSLVAALRELQRAGWDDNPDLLVQALRACESGQQESA